jgi:hypothetical protein
MQNYSESDSANSWGFGFDVGLQFEKTTGIWIASRYYNDLQRLEYQ